MTKTVEEQTGKLFGSLWHRLTDEQYRQSVELFTKRFNANGFDLSWFAGKRCLDAGTGSGRYAVAMAMHGADVIGCDISEAGLMTAKERAAGIPNLRFQKGSVLDLPFENASFDFVCSAGVLHHTPSIERGLDELTRVLRPGGRLFLLLYGAGGLRWMLVRALRPLVKELGYEAVDRAIEKAGLPANNRKHFLDDLFVPILKQVKASDLTGWLQDRGYADVHFWSKEKTFDHEANIDAQIADMEKLRLIFANGEDPLFTIGTEVARAFVATAKTATRDLVIGEGNQRVMAILR
jgi:ubiquinone/menaquinone biosynthesis C-methylase UbiE